jgi:hypothetical protein
VKIFKYPIIGPYTPLRTPRRTCRYLSGPEILEVRNYLPQYTVTCDETPEVFNSKSFVTCDWTLGRNGTVVPESMDLINK